MEKFNWKEEARQSLKGYVNDLWYCLCLFLAAGLVASMQTEKQFQAIVSFIIEGDWSIIAIIIIGIMHIAIVIEKVLKVICMTMKFIFNHIFQYMCSR